MKYRCNTCICISQKSKQEEHPCSLQLTKQCKSAKQTSGAYKVDMSKQAQRFSKCRQMGEPSPPDRRRCPEHRWGCGHRARPTHNPDFLIHAHVIGCATGSAPAATRWPSGLRRQLQALVRKGVGSNPTLVSTKQPSNFLSASGRQLASQPGTCCLFPCYLCTSCLHSRLLRGCMLVCGEWCVWHSFALLIMFGGLPAQ